MPAGSSITYVVTGTVSATATGTLTNTAAITPAVGAAASATDSDNLAELSVGKTDNATSAGNVIPGQSLTYTVVVSNTGLGNVTGASISDPLPANFTGATWTATGTGGASGFATTGTGNLENIASLPAGSTTATGTLTNTVTVTPPVGNAVSSTDSDNLADLSVTKIDDAGGSSITSSIGSVIPDQALTYTIVVSNTGLGSVTGATIADSFPTDFVLVAWTATETGGASGFLTTGSGNISQSGVNLSAGSTITYTVTGTVSVAAAGSFTNSVAVTPPTGTAVSAADTDMVLSLAP